MPSGLPCDVNDSKARARISSGMPGPSSVQLSTSADARVATHAERDRAAARAPIACTALRTRLCTARRSCADRTTRRRGPRARSSSSMLRPSSSWRRCSTSSLEVVGQVDLGDAAGWSRRARTRGSRRVIALTVSTWRRMRFAVLAAALRRSARPRGSARSRRSPSSDRAGRARRSTAAGRSSTAAPARSRRSRACARSIAFETWPAITLASLRSSSVKLLRPCALFSSSSAPCAVAEPQRHAQHRARVVADLVRDLGRVARIAAHVVDDLRLAVARDPAADALVRGDRQAPHGVGRRRRPRSGSAGRRVCSSDIKIEPASAPIACIARAEHALEQLVEPRRARRHLGDLEQDVELAHLLLEPLLGLEQLHVLADDRQEQLAVLERDRDLRRERRAASPRRRA